MADVVENIVIDQDTVPLVTIDDQFQIKYNLISEKAVSLHKNYISSINGTNSLKLVITLSDNSIEIYELSNTSLSKVCRLSGHQKGIREAVFIPKDDNLVVSCGEDGLLKLWDTRASGTCVQEYKDEEEEIVRPFQCMDISCNGRVFCAGSQLVQDDAYLVFWDQRHTKPLGGYWNSHTDDITQVRFHKQKPEILSSGSDDGLLNIYNITEQTEDDALTYSLNIENSVEKLSWLDDKNIASITQSNDLQVWNTETGDVIKSFDREKVAKSIKRSRSDDCYLVDTFVSLNKQYLLAGSYEGNGDVLRSVDITDKKLLPGTNFKGNKQIVRCCWHNENRDILATAGESGMISLWSKGDDDVNKTPNKNIKATKKPHKRHNPY